MLFQSDTKDQHSLLFKIRDRASGLIANRVTARQSLALPVLRDDKGISTLEFDGVELAAIQGLNQKVEEQLKAKDAEIQQLKARLEKLEQMLETRNGGGK